MRKPDIAGLRITSRIARKPSVTRGFGVLPRLNECIGDSASIDTSGSRHYSIKWSVPETNPSNSKDWHHGGRNFMDGSQNGPTLKTDSYFSGSSLQIPWLLRAVRCDRDCGEPRCSRRRSCERSLPGTSSARLIDWAPGTTLGSASGWMPPDLRAVGEAGCEHAGQ
jgi:hypothetical protein